MCTYSCTALSCIACLFLSSLDARWRYAKGYLRADFEELWHDYEISVTPSHAAKIVALERHLRNQGNGAPG